MEYLNYDQLSTLPVMSAVAIGLAIGWGIVLEISKKKMMEALPSTEWWVRAIEPQKSMMYNFGYPKKPTKQFPEGMTEPMVRDSFAYTATIVFQHFVSALLMIPVVLYGWEDSSDTVKSLFILGTLSDLGFDIYDTWNISMKTFSKNHPYPAPFEFWVILIAMHHTTAMFLVLPMNLNYVYRFEYHQTAFSLLMAAALCYGSGCYKYTLNIIENKRDFIMYKLVVLLQLGIILFTRLYLWFPATISFRNHLREQNDTKMFYGASIMITILSLFNVILIIDGFKAAIKSIPKKFGKTREERERTSIALRRMSSIDTPGLAPLKDVVKFVARRKFKAAVHSVIAANRLESSSLHSDKKAD